MATTGRQQREQRRAERLAAQKNIERSNQLRKYGLIGAIAVIIIAAVAVFAVTGRQSAAPGSSGVPGEQHLNDPMTAQGKLYSHVPEGSPIQYDSYPPAFGPHYDQPKAWQAFDTPVPEGYFVHNLEHGGIVILYHCPSGCADTVSQLKGLYSSLPKDKFNEVKLVIAPYDRETHLITLLAWDYRLEMDSFDRGTIENFYKAHVDKSPEQVA